MAFIFFGMMVAFFISVMLWVGIYYEFGRMKRDVQMKTLKTPMIKQIVGKHKDCNNLGIEITNPKHFVEKQMKRIGVFVIFKKSLTLKEIITITLIAKYLIAAMAIVSALVMRVDVEQCYVVLGIGSLMFLSLNLTEQLVNVDELRRELILDLVDVISNNIVFPQESYLSKYEGLTREAEQEFHKLTKQYREILKNT